LKTPLLKVKKELKLLKVKKELKARKVPKEELKLKPKRVQKTKQLYS